MAEKRRYLATMDDGHDWHEVVFESQFRAGSKNNENDARTTAIRKHGKIARGWKVTRVQRWFEEC